MMRVIYLLLILTLVSSAGYAQTGPAGVGNFDGSNGQPENIIWLDASTLGLADGAPILTWPDLSGNGNDLVQLGGDNTPLLETSGLFSGSYNVARFDGTERYLRLLDNTDLDASLGGVTVIAVVYNATLDNAPRGIYSKRASSSSQQSYSAFTYTSARLNFDVHNGTNQRLASSTSLNTTSDYIFTNRYSGSLQEIFLQSVTSGSASFTGDITDSNSDLILGALNENYGTYFDGDIAELIFYREGLNDAERLLVENYLSQKYAISITNDFFGTDAAFNSSFVNDIVGIGTSDGSSKFSDSGFSDAMKVTELAGSLNASNEFVMTAHDNTVHADGVTADITVDPGVLDSRWARSWYVESTGSVSSELTFDFGTAGLPFSGNASDYVILYRPNTSSNYTRLLANSYTVANGDQLVVNLGNISLPTGYYTIGEGQQLVPGNWYSYQTGDWNDPLTWTTASDGSLREPVTGGVPTSSDNVTILSGRTVTMDTDDNDGVILKVDGGLDIVNTSGHDFFTIEGNGIIYIAGDVSNNDNFPTGSAQLFADSIVGGTVIVNGIGINLDQAREYNNLVVDLTNSTDVATQLADYTIIGDFTLTKGIFQINDNSATNALSTTVYGDVQVAASAEINVGSANARHEFNFYGDFLTNGTAEFTNRIAADYNNEATDGIVDANFLNGSKNQTIDCNGVTNFYRIEIDKGTDQTYILDINASSTSNFNLYGPADYGHGSIAQLTTNDNALGLLKGTVRLNANVDVPVLNNTGNYNISEAARLWVNGGSTTKPSGTAIVPYGTIQLSAGTLDAPINSGITTRDNGNIVVEGGVMTINQIRTSILGPTALGGYTQSGGTVNVIGNNISTGYYAFSLTYPGNTFNMSGGTLKVSGAPTGSTTGGIFIASSDGNQNITGGTVIMEINRDNDFKLTSLSPFWNVIMRYTSGTGGDIDMIDGTSGTGGGATTITNLDLRVLNNLTIENGVRFDHHGFDVEIGSDFLIELGASYIYNSNRKNTTTINGSDNSLLSFLNLTNSNPKEQKFWNLVIDKPHGKVVSLASGKADLTGNQNNLFRIEGDNFKVLSGTLDQGYHSIRMYADTLVNYDILTVYDPTNPTDDNVANGNNDIFKLRDDGGVPTIFITADTARFGAIKLNSANEIITLNSDVKIDYLDYRHGRLNIQDNNLTIDFLDENLTNEAKFDLNEDGTFQNNEKKIFSPADMIITNGTASNGGLSLYVSGNNVYTFPLGIGTDATELLRNNSKYTPATVTVSNYSDDGYITIRPADNVLATTDPGGGDILSYYWKVDYEGFSVLPTVEYQYTYYDVDLDGSVNEATFVPGKVLENSPFTRSSEIAANLDDVNNLITFDADGGGGFTLENTSYTAGQAPRFVGAPAIYYTRGGGNFNNATSWSKDQQDGSGTQEVPVGGSIITIQNGNRINVRAAIPTLGKVIFDHDYGVNPIATSENVARLQFHIPGTFDLGAVSGTGMVSFDARDARVVNGDFGLFGSNADSYYLYFGGNATLNSIPAPIPNIMFESATYAIDQAIDVNYNLIIQGNGRVRALQDMTIGRNLFLGFWQGGTFEFYATATPITVTVSGDVDFSQDFNTTGSRQILVRNVASAFEHELIVKGDIIQTSAATTVFDLYNGVGNLNAILELQGESNNTFVKKVGNTADFYRIVANKGTNQSNSFSFKNTFNLLGTSSTAVKALELQNGTVILNNAAINIDLTTGGADFAIPASSSLQVTLGTVNVSGDDSGIALDGSLIIDGGTVNMDDAIGNGNNYIEYSSSGGALIDISSGVLDVGSQIRPITSANTGILKYRQTGGDVRIGTQSAPESTRGMLQIYNSGSEFTYTGGTLTIERHQTTPSVAALYLDPATSDVTGSTITIFNGNTPVGQSDFRINSFIALNNVAINGSNNPTATLNVNGLTVNDLTIASGATLLGDGRTLTVGGDFTNDGIYNAEFNETIFESSLNQNLLGSGTNTFYRFTKNGTGTLTLTNSIDIGDLFSISNGTIDDNGFSINLAADAVIDGTHLSVGGAGLVFSGAANQELRRSATGTGNLGVISINNISGVTIPSGNGYDFNIAGGLNLDKGVFDIGSSFIQFGIGADIVAVSPFSVSNMIKTNSSFVDGGISKQFAANYNQDFTLPVGQAFYTPVSFDFATPGNTFGSTAGMLTIRPANEYHPTINDGSDFFATGDINNVLQYYWTSDASGINGLIANMTLQYDQSQVLTDEPGYDETDYLSARILTNNNPTSDINKFDVSDVDESLNTIVFGFTGESSDGITGDYFAGIDEAIPANVATYTVDTDGNIDDDIYDIAVPGGGAPSGAVVIVPNGFNATLNIDNIRLYKTEIQSGGTLVVDNTTNHRLGTLEGTGILKIVSDGINANLPAFSGNFLSCSGGGIEYAGTGSYSVMPGIASVRNLVLSGTGNRDLANNDITICEDLTLNGPTFNNSNNRIVTTTDELIITSGIFNSGAGTIDVNGNMTVNGGLYDNQTGGLLDVAGLLAISSGTFNVGSGGAVYLRGNVNFTGGTFNAGSSTAAVRFNGSALQVVTGNFTGGNSFYNVEIYNDIRLSNSIVINNNLTLSSGIIDANGNNVTFGSAIAVSPASGTSSSYINGKVLKPITSVGESFTFPIGSAALWRPASVNTVSSGGLTWEAEYFQNSPLTEGLVDNLTPTNPGQIETISNGEYWKISDGNAGVSGVTATIGLSWGFESDVSAFSSEREELQVMAWNDGTTTWDNFGGTSFSGSHTQNGGTFESSSTIGFSENIITLGSADIANALPVELVSFKAKTLTSAVNLLWETASELNNDYFTLLRSKDGYDFEEVATILGAGTSVTELTYSFVDERPLQGLSYYKLLQTDFDGTEVEVGLISIKMADSPQELLISSYPNPFNKEVVNISVSGLNEEELVPIVITDGFGRQYYYEKHLADSSGYLDFTIEDTHDWGSGIYVVQIRAEKGAVQTKLIKL